MAFPNDLGNYRGKRKPAPRFNGGVPLTPAERRELLGAPPPANTPLRRKLSEIVAASALRLKRARKRAPKPAAGLAELEADYAAMVAAMTGRSLAI